MGGNARRHPLEILVLAISGGTAFRDVDEAAGRAATIASAGSWGAVVGTLTSRAPPAAFVFAAVLLDDPGRRTIAVLHRRGLLVPTAAYLGDLTPEMVRRVYPLARFGVRLLFPGPELGGDIRDLLRGAPEIVASRVIRALAIRDVVVLQFLRLLAESDAARWSPAELAARLHVSRNALFRQVRDAGLPTVEQCQFLFRLLPAANSIARGARTGDAAFLAGFSDAAALGKSLRRRLQLSVSEIRAGLDPRALADRWLELHARPAAPRPATTGDPARERVRWNLRSGRWNLDGLSERDR